MPDCIESGNIQIVRAVFWGQKVGDGNATITGKSVNQEASGSVIRDPAPSPTIQNAV
ncbi:MAG: hypothetical protein WCP07_06655 [bacterium]